MEPITLPEDYEITATLCHLYRDEVMANHFIPKIAAAGNRVMDAEQLAGFVIETYESVKPLLVMAGHTLSIIDLRTIALALCVGSDREVTKRVQRTLIEMRRLERMFQAPSFQKPS